MSFSSPRLCFAASLCALLAAIPLRAEEDPVRFVDPLIGTGAHGHTVPGATAPFGLVQISPDTNDVEDWDWCGGYHDADKTLMGFSHTHLSGTGVGDLGNILFMPQSGEIKWEPGTLKDPAGGYRAGFSHVDEKAAAGYYQVKLDAGINVELTASERAAVHRYTYPAEKAALLIDLAHKVYRKKDSKFEGALTLESPTTVTGWQHTGGWSADKTFYFAAEFSHPIVGQEFRVDGATAKGASAKGVNVKGAFFFDLKKSEPLIIKVGLSAVSVQKAKRNLSAEIGSRDFETVRDETVAKWNAALGRIKIETSDVAHKRIFYTALYHTMVTPNLYDDVDGAYVGPDRKAHEPQDFHYYSTFSLWDTFRAANPLYTLIQPERVRDFIRTMLAHFENAPSPQLPVWTLAGNDTFCMIGYHSIPVIVDAYFKGIRPTDPKKTLEAMKMSANAREGHEQYVREGFAPSGWGNAQGTSRTLEYAFDDWCIAQYAEAIGAKEDAVTYRRRAQNFRNVFDTREGFMRGRGKDGKWLEPFSPIHATNDVFTEGNSWHYSWSVMHDIPALIELMGGKGAFTAKLDEMWVTTGEMNAMPDVSGLIGMYAHGNEPSHHVAYLYDYAGQPWKTQKWARRILTTMYSDQRDGLCGNEDCGQMSAWYVFSALGFYPVNPASGVYAIGSPLFAKASITLGETGKQRTFTIRATENSSENVYIQSATLNGTPLDRAWITQRELSAGGELEFVMGPKPNENWGVRDLPPALGY